MWHITITQLLQVKGKKTWHLHTSTTELDGTGAVPFCRKLTCVPASVAVFTTTLTFCPKMHRCLCFSCSQVGSGDFSSCPGLKAGLHFGQVTNITSTLPMRRDNQPSSRQSIDCACLWIVQLTLHYNTDSLFVCIPNWVVTAISHGSSPYCVSWHPIQFRCVTGLCNLLNPNWCPGKPRRCL